MTLRGESIAGQLDGSIPSTESAQRSSDALIDASHLDLSVMGSMNMGGMGGGGDRDFSFTERSENGEDRGLTAQTTSASATPPTGSGGMPGGFGSFGGGELPEGFEDMQLPEGMDPSQFAGQMPEGMDPSQFSGQMPGGFGQTGETGGDATTDETRNDGQSGQSQQRPDTGSMSGMNWNTQTGGMNSTLVTYGLCAVVMLMAFLFALFYRRRPRKR